MAVYTRIKIDLEEGAALARLKGAGAVLRAGNSRAEDESVAHIMPVAVAKAPKLTGRLAASISAGRDEGGATLFSNERYAYYRHWGSRKNEPDEFLLDAALETRDQWETYFRLLLQKAIGA